MISERDSRYDPVAGAEFRATTSMEIRNLREHVRLLWKETEKRRLEIQAISNRINGAVWSAAAFMVAVIFSMVKTKIGL